MLGNTNKRSSLRSIQSVLYLERRNDGAHQSKHRFQRWRAFERAEMLEGFAMEGDTKKASNEGENGD